MMKLEYIEIGSPDCPLIRIFNFDNNDLDSMVNLLNGIVPGKRIYLTDLKTVSPLNDIELIFTGAAQTLGIIKIDENKFECFLDNDGVKSIIGKIIEIRNNSKSSYNWLNETSQISLLLSKNGMW